MKFHLSIVALLVAACGGGSSPSDNTGGSGGALTRYEPCSQDRRIGGFELVSDEDLGTKSFVGSAREKVVSENVFSQAMQTGACRLLKPRTLFCNPSCMSGESCSEAGSCVKNGQKTFGTVKVTGLATPLSLMPNGVGNYYADFESLPAEGTALQLEAGSGSSAFELKGWAPAALVVPAGMIPIERGKPMALKWTAPSKEGPARVHIELDISHHGGLKGLVVCDVPDTGSYEIPAPLVTALIDLGVAGFPVVSLTRRSADSATVDGACVDFTVGSLVERQVSIPGLVSCDPSSPECPQGQTCGDDLACH